MAGIAFRGWPPEALDFLRELEANNDRDWFKANRARYDDYLVAPTVALGQDLAKLGRPHMFRPWTNTRFGASEGEAYMAFVVDVVKPYVDGHYRTKSDRDDTAIMGSSMGGLMSHYALLRYPGIFSKAGVFSPAYWINPEVTAYTRENAPPSDARLYLYGGGKEGAEMLDGFRAMAGELRKTMPREGQLEVRVIDANEHNEKAWRSEFPRAVRWLFRLKPE